MCGLIAAFGGVTKKELSFWSKRLKHRGPDGSNIYFNESISMAFNRLAINDPTELGDQPYKFGQYVTMINGEIYNHDYLKEKYQLQYLGQADTNIIGPLFEKLGKEIIHQLDGFYSGVVFNKYSNKLYTLRDYIGKKGLFLVKKGLKVIITSELKAIPSFDSFEVIPKGVCEINLSSGEIKQVQHHSVMFDKPSRSLSDILKEAVIKRLPKDNAPFGVFLSGGLDSSILAYILVELQANSSFYILGDENNSTDFPPAMSLIKNLGISNYRVISLPSKDELPKLIEQVVKTTESYNPSIISNGICTYLLSQAAKNDNLKVVLSGEGADELFGGYKYQEDSDKWKVFRSKLLTDMHFTELRRVDLTCMSNGIEARFPYLDRQIYEFSQALEYGDLYSFYDAMPISKFVLRKEYEHCLSRSIIWRKKISSDVGSGIRSLVVNYLQENYESEKVGLKAIWSKFYKYNHIDNYFHSYPCFDSVIEKRGGSHK